MTRLLVVCGMATWAGVTLFVSRLRWFSRPGLVERLRPYVASGAAASSSPPGILSVDSFRELVGPASRAAGEALARLLGVSEGLELRLERIHSPLDATAFRVRQLGWSLMGFGAGAMAALALRPPPIVGLLFVLGAPLFAFLLVEQQVANASRAWQRRVFLELPVIAEQLAMLLSAGFSLNAALTRIAARGQGACARDLARVCGRVRLGLTEIEALREWAAVVNVDALDHLVPLLALNREAADLARLISEEARSIRREVQRQLVETIERRAQQVWIPVTVATLVPGVIFMAVPFVEALRLFSS